MITSIRLQNFRSYKDDSFEFSEGVNIVVGPNASGKTNLLESVLVLGRGNSFRARDNELINFGAPWARLEGVFGKHSRVLKLEGEPIPNKSFLIGDKPYKRLNLERTTPIVLFEPNHLQLLTRGPDQRREYFDDLLERSRLEFKPLVTSYRRTLAQRNALLKQNPGHAAKQLFAWNVRLSELGGKIAAMRFSLIEDINQSIDATYSRIAKQKSVVKLTYESQFPIDNYSSRMFSKLEDHTRLDFERGFTAHGPHREDIGFSLNGQPVGQTASRGEVRSLLLSLKIYELGLIEKARDQRPIFLLDDVFSELDGARRHALVDYLQDFQSIITTTEADAVLEYFSREEHKLIPTSKPES
jgi:DNA replication and repair protein RecF